MLALLLPALGACNMVISETPMCADADAIEEWRWLRAEATAKAN